MSQLSSHFCPKVKSAFKMFGIEPWLVWLSDWNAGLGMKGSLVPSPVRAHAWVAAGSPVGGAQEATTH